MISHNCNMAVFVIFVLGIGNFALHKATIESRNSLVREVPWLRSRRGRQVSLGIEFTVLLAAMLLAGNGWGNIAWAYFLYSGLNGVSAWLILSGRV